VDGVVEGRGDGVRRGHEGLKWAPAALGGGRGQTVGSVAPRHERRGQWNPGCHGRQRPDLDAQGEPSAAGVVATICFSPSLEVGFCRWRSRSLLESASHRSASASCYSKTSLSELYNNCSAKQNKALYATANCAGEELAKRPRDSFPFFTLQSRRSHETEMR
jgi:hypothetical protein